MVARVLPLVPECVQLIPHHEYRWNMPITRTDVSLTFFWQSPGVPGLCDVLEPIMIVEQVLSLGGPNNQVGIEH